MNRPYSAHHEPSEALAILGGPSSRAALEQALQGVKDPEARQEMLSAHEHFGKPRVGRK